MALADSSDRLPQGCRSQRSASACRVALYVALADSSVGLVDAEEGSSLSNTQWVRPKNACTALALALLDVQGQPVGPYAAHLQLHWASNNAAVAAADSGKPCDQSNCLLVACKGRLHVAYGSAARGPPGIGGGHGSCPSKGWEI